MEKRVELTKKVPESLRGKRLDKAVAGMFPKYSRARLKSWILDKRVLIDGRIKDKPSRKVLPGEIVFINPEIEKKLPDTAQNIFLNVVYEDEDILVIYKPRNLVVHPGKGNPDGTLLNALLHYYPPLSEVPRSGIVHRLDKNTTGLMIIAKTVLSQIRLIELFRLRKISREYEAIVIGHLMKEGTIDAPISRHPSKRTHMSVNPKGKSAITHYWIIENFRMHTHLRLRLETGRTHQIRVHMAHISHPLVGDPIYGRENFSPFAKGMSTPLKRELYKFDRPALHATMLRLCHPISEIKMEWNLPVPKDMMDLIEAMRADSKKQSRTALIYS